LKPLRLLDLGCVLAGAAFFSTLLWWWWRPDEVFLLLLGLWAVRLWVAPIAVPAWPPRRVLAVGILTYAAVFSFITVTRHLTLLTHALDLGYYVQLTWNLARGAGPLVSLPEMNAWGDHLSPIMYLLAPLFWVTPGAVALLVAQAVALALGALAVFGIAARRHACGRRGAPRLRAPSSRNGVNTPAESLTNGAATAIAPPSPLRPRTTRSVAASTASTMKKSLWNPPTPYTSSSGFSPTRMTAGTAGLPSAWAHRHRSQTHPRLASTTTVFSPQYEPAMPSGTSR